MEDSGESIELALKDIVAKFSDEMKGEVSGDAGSANVKIPLVYVQKQLSTGAVKILFSDLKSRAPQGVFSSNTENDGKQVIIPLELILPKLKPEDFKLKANQETITVSPEITDVFNTEGTGNTGNAVNPAEGSAPAAAPTPAAEATKPEPTPTATPEPTAPAAPAPASAPAAAATTPAGDTVAVALSEASAAWPDAIKSAVSGSSASIQLPVAEAEPMMKKGKVAFSWSAIKGMTSPAVDTAAAAGENDTILEIPISLVIPQFMALKKPSNPDQKTLEVDEKIPDVFNAENKPAATAKKEEAAEPEAPATPAPSPIDPAPAAPAPSPIDPTPAAPAPAPAAASGSSMDSPELSALLGNPSKTSWTHAEAADAAAKLPGVSGILISTTDGLPVAKQVAADIQVDAVAGVIPEIFNRQAQFAKDTGLGAVVTVTLELEGKVLLVAKGKKTFFAALGESAMLLPKDKLKKIAGLLD